MSERRVRLLYRTDCWQCDQAVEAGTATWWDDDRCHATCVECFPDRGDTVAADAVQTLILPDLRSSRRLELARAGGPRSPRRPARRPTSGPDSPS